MTPKWVKPERQAELVKLFAESNGFCVFTQKPCQGEWHESITVLCAWGNRCNAPQSRWRTLPLRTRAGQAPLALSLYSRPFFKMAMCLRRLSRATSPMSAIMSFIRIDWLKSGYRIDRVIQQARWQNERNQLHSLGERRERL